MSDPFLLHHAVGPYLFDISGRLTPVSIRDQMVRARTITDRLFENGLIDGTRDLLVIGAGAAGVTAAVRAVRRGVKTRIIDIDRPFSRQRGCASRWIDPTQFDWPLPHWRQAVFPWTFPPMPLPWGADRASQVVAAWDIALLKAITRYGKKLEVWLSASMTPPPRPGPTDVTVDIIYRGRTRTDAYGAVLFTVGPGTEKCDVNTYSGYKFWDNDYLEASDFNVATGKKATVFISGGGDGALQDYLRTVTRYPSAKEVYDELRNASGSPELWAEIERNLQAAEDQAERAYIWGATARHDHAVMDALHAAHRKEVEGLRDGSHWASVSDALKQIVRVALPPVMLAHPCTHFSKCYGLNRFLVLLIAEYFYRERNEETLLPGVAVFDVKGVSHICANQPDPCHGHEHEITVNRVTCTKSSAAPERLPHHYNVVVVRHGIAPPARLYGGTRVSLPRQLLPYRPAQ